MFVGAFCLEATLNNTIADILLDCNRPQMAVRSELCLGRGS